MFKRTLLIGLFGVCYSTFAFSANKNWVLEGVLIKSNDKYELILNPGTPVMKSISIDRIAKTAKYFQEYKSGTVVSACFSGASQPSTLTRIEPLAPSLDAKFVENIQNALVSACPF